MALDATVFPLGLDFHARTPRPIGGKKFDGIRCPLEQAFGSDFFELVVVVGQEFDASHGVAIFCLDRVAREFELGLERNGDQPVDAVESGGERNLSRGTLIPEQCASPRGLRLGTSVTMPAKVLPWEPSRIFS